MLTRTELASICRFIACLLVSEEKPAEAAATTTAEPGATPAAPKRRGRPPGSTAAPAEPAAPGATPAPELPKEQKTEEKPAATPTTVEGALDLDGLRKVIRPLIEATRGPEIKTVLNKYAPEGFSGDYTLMLLSERPEVHAAFVKDIETLKM